MAARARLLDIEGTTTPVSFVYDVLFPFARGRVGAFLQERRADEQVRRDLALLRDEHARDDGAPPWPDAGDPGQAAAYACWIMDRDRKSTALKALQGRIWEEGYRSGALRGEVYPDVPAALRRWRGEGRAVAIFSSGSMLAQRLLFAHSTAGDLTPLIAAYFDTTTGPKREAESYARIADALGCPPAEVLFLSDVAAELDAARAAGMATALCVRGEPPAETSGHPVVRTFHGL